MDTVKRPFLCIVDPSLKDFIGHHFEYDRAVVEGAVEEGYDAVCLAHCEAIDALKSRIPLVPAFALDIWTTPPGLEGDYAAVEEAANEQFYKDLKAATTSMPLDRDAIVFGHMITARQLHGFARFATEHAGTDGPLIVLLLRYQPEHYMGALAEKAFALLQTAASRGRVRLSSDSSRLASQLQRLTTLPVETWPLPHTSELGDTPKAIRRKKKPLRVVSLGNARDEKGIFELMNAVRILEVRGEAHRFEFHFQVNDANADVAPAIAAFEAEDHPQAVHYKESMSTEVYFELLKSADIVATPYWRDIYFARTSGIFLEAVAAGKPVVCTRDTWMSDQLSLCGAGVLVNDRDAADLAAALIEIADNYASMLKQAQGTRKRWLQIHSPLSFMRALLHMEFAPTAKSSRPSVAVMYPWGDALQNTAGAALRLNLFLRFLSERSGKVRLLEDGDHSDVSRQGVTFEAMPVDRVIKTSIAYKWISRVARHILGAKNGEEVYFALMLLPQFSRTMFRRVNELVQNSDLIFLEYPFWAPLVARACKAHGKRFVLNNYDVISDQVRVSKPLKWLTEMLERRALKMAGVCVAVTENDRAKFAAWGVASLLSPNCVDAEAATHQLPWPSRAILDALSDMPDGVRHIFLFVGSKFLPNVLAAEAVRRIASAFQQAYPDAGAQFIVAGGCMEPIREPGFMALGRIDDVHLKLFYEHCDAVLVPLTIGTGLSLKTVEALAAGKVIVGTGVAFRGIPTDEVDGWIEENDLDAYPQRLYEAISRREYSASLSVQARKVGGLLDFRTAFAPYLNVEPRLAESVPILTHPEEKYRTYVLDAAQAALNAGLGEVALKLLDALIVEQPDKGEAYRMRAEVYAARHDYALALDDLDAAIARRSPAAEILRSKAQILEKIDQPDMAAQAVDAAVKITVAKIWTPVTEVPLREALWKEFHGGDQDWVYRVANMARLQKPSGLPQDYAYFVGHILAGRGQNMDNALASAHEAMEAGYDRFWSLMLIGQILRSQGKAEESLATFYEAASIAPNADAKATAANNVTIDLWPMFEAGRYEAVLERARTVCAAWPDHPTANYLMGETMKILGQDLMEACAAYQRSLDGGFRAFVGLTSLGQLQISLGDPDTGLASIVRGFGDAHTESERSVVRGALVAGVRQGANISGAEKIAFGLVSLSPEERTLLVHRLSADVHTLPSATAASLIEAGLIGEPSSQAA